MESDVNEETSTENNTSTDNDELYDIPQSKKTIDLKEQMARWICHYNVTHTAAGALLKAFNKLLDDDAGARNQYKKMIQIRGGRDVKKHIRQILITILNDDLACKLSWTGQKKTIGVKDMKFVDVFVEAMIASEACTIHEVQTIIQSWLQHAGDRVRYHEKKHNA
ncbi:uncharacterized protein LOC112639615 [Camponotus floridanus]|uniref:uncharacterized protein LOC112639615 n=1 Tax=Camponotus floridanus TaxID=104421 RepID=UPI000DC6A231|nr:uncharacterized protein LOC112639615 [Camponotus floridanus]